MLKIEYPCSHCGGGEFRFTKRLWSWNNHKYRAVCCSCWEDLAYEELEDGGAEEKEGVVT